MKKNQKDKAFETQVREQMQQRTLEPSAQAWDRLDAMLTVAEQPKRKYYGWYAVAAVFLIGGLLGFWTWQQDTVSVEMPAIVLDENTSQTQETFITPIQEKVVPVVSEEQVVEVVPSAQKKETIIIHEARLKEVNSIQIQEALVVHEPTLDIKTPEVEPILENALAEQNGLSVDPLKLLNAVEKEVEIQHRNKVIESINKNYQTFKQALATRNLE
jgi:hypothetical protein